MQAFVRAAAISGLLSMAFIPEVHAQATSADLITGLWAYETIFPTGLSGELSVTRHDKSWRGSIAGTTAEAQASGNEIRIQFPNEGGLFRGYPDRDGRLVRGFWVRREISDDPRYPEGAAQGYAMPLNLRPMERPAGERRWLRCRSFHAVPQRFRDESGALKAAIRNPEHHRFGPAMQMFATLEGDQLRLGKAAAPGDDDLTATVSRSPERIEMHWEGLERSISLARATPAQAALFTARPRTEPRYVYREPQASNDGWRTARAGELGVDESALARAVQRIIDIDPSAQRAWLIHSLAIAYKGKLILDEYFYGHGPDQPHDMRSASKTFSSVTLGGAMLDGAKISPQTKLYEVMAPLGPFANPDPRKGASRSPSDDPHDGPRLRRNADPPRPATRT